MKRIFLILGLLGVAGAGAAAVWLNRPRPAPPQSASNFYIESAEAHLRFGRVTAAVIDFNRAIAMSPRDERGFVGLARLYEEQARADLALETLEMLRASNPDAPHLPLLMAEASLGVNDASAALRYAQEALRREPDSAEAHLVSGVTLARLKQWDAALQALREAQRLSPKDMKVGQTLLEVYIKRGDYAQSVQTGEALLAELPRSARLHYRLGWAYARLKGDPRAQQQAIEHLNTAAELLPDWHEPFLEMGRIALERGDAAQARTALERAWQRNPLIPEIAEQLAPLWRNAGDPRAEALRQKAQELRRRRKDYLAQRESEKTPPLSPKRVCVLAQQEASAGFYEAALYRLKRLLTSDSTNLQAIRLYRAIDAKARSGYPDYLRPGPHATLASANAS